MTLPKPGDPYRKKNPVRRILSNNPTRASRPGFKPQSRNQIEGKRSIRRLIKRNPSDGLSQPFADKMTTTHVNGPGLDGVPSPTRVLKADKTPTPNKGKRVIRPARIALGKRLKQGQ
jgi:hypothetical protein